MKTREVLQHGGSILGSIILRGTFRRISQLWNNAHTLNLEICLLYLSSIIAQFLDFIHWMVLILFFIAWQCTHSIICWFYTVTSSKIKIVTIPLSEQSHQDLGLCGFAFARYSGKCSAQMYRALYRDAMLVPIQMGGHQHGGCKVTKIFFIEFLLLKRKVFTQELQNIENDTFY